VTTSRWGWLLKLKSNILRASSSPRVESLVLPCRLVVTLLSQTVSFLARSGIPHCLILSWMPATLWFRHETRASPCRFLSTIPSVCNVVGIVIYAARHFFQIHLILSVHVSSKACYFDTFRIYGVQFIFISHSIIYGGGTSSNPSTLNLKASDRE